MIGDETIVAIQQAVFAEKESGTAKYGVFHSHHEAWAVTKEEAEELLEGFVDLNKMLNKTLDSLWVDIRKDGFDDFSADAVLDIRDGAVSVCQEAIQLAAMCDKWMDLFNNDYLEEKGE